MHLIAIRPLRSLLGFKSLVMRVGNQFGWAALAGMRVNCMIRITSLFVIMASAMILLLVAPEVFLVVFAGTLLAVMLQGDEASIVSRQSL